jgi:hypothetical protein
VTLVLKKYRSSIGLEIRPQSAFTDFKTLLPSAKYSTQRSGQGCGSQLQIVMAVWFFKIIFKRAKQPLLSAVGHCTKLNGQHDHLTTFHGILFKGSVTL